MAHTYSHLPVSGDVGGAQFCFHAKIFNDELVLVFALNFALIVAAWLINSRF